VHGRVGIAHHFGRGPIRLAARRDADADGTKDAAAAQLEGFPQLPQDALRHLRSLRRTGQVAQQDRELVAAQPRGASRGIICVNLRASVV
jgi:hypothetical protein